ncbi:MAG TPA: spore cortex-lytic enzyme [Bacillota bacterium]|nr:spore cortex-lytic enzyme [Bacillota bacterium]
MLKLAKWQRILAIGLITVMGTGFIAFTRMAVAPAISRALYWGSSGQPVKELQWKLYQWGYFNGKIDGDFGQDTYNGVKKFQANNGLPADGVAGKSTLKGLGLWTGTTATTAGSRATRNTATTRGLERRGDVTLLAHVIHAEAGAEPYEGKVAVGAVILNRVDSAEFPNTLGGVIYQPLAFESVSNGLVNGAPSAESIRAAQDAINGYDPTYGCLFFWNPAKKVSKWIWSRKIVSQIGKHVFAL